MIDYFEVWNRDQYMQKYVPMLEKISEIEEELNGLSGKKQD
jgi:hypothetical protein